MFFFVSSDKSRGIDMLLSVLTCGTAMKSSEQDFIVVNGNARAKLSVTCSREGRNIAVSG